jgi:hypothetical protein
VPGLTACSGCATTRILTIGISFETGGREAQDAALNAEEPAFFDADSEDLFVWYTAEVAKRAAEPESAFRGRKDRLPIDGQDLAEELVAASTLTGSAPRKGNGRRRHV